MNKSIKYGLTSFKPKFQLDYELCEYYWVSFSLNGINQGCCTIKAKSNEEAIKKATKLHNEVKYNDILALPMPYDITEPNKLISKEELLKNPNFGVVKT